ncbi:MAG: hypothetical protein DLD55_00020 [candidate division SR1 bacterium]|nr:MAG: hypothetical protein DLD55_00020 [candidate division SR1 bacterium]
MAVKNAIEIIISATDKASAVLSKSANSLKGTADKMSDFAKNNEFALMRIKQTGVDTLKTLGTYIGDFTDKASKTKEASEAMERLSKNMNISSKDILSGLQKASKGTVSNYDLILSANKAMSLGVAKNTNDFTTLMDIARVKAKNMGITTTQAYNDIVTGLGRGSAMILDNLGITVNAAAANEEYAKSIGKTVNQLTDAEKKQALINKVVTDGRKELEAAGEVMLTDAERRQKLIAQIENMKDRIGNALLPTVQKLMEAVTPLIERFTQWVERNPELVAGIIKVVAVLGGLMTVIGSIGLSVGPLGIGLNILSKAFGFVSSFGGLAAKAISAIGPTLTALTGPIGWVVAALAALGVAYATNFGGFRDFVHEVRAELQPVLVEIGTVFKEVFLQIGEVISEVWNQLAEILKPLRDDFGPYIKAVLLGIVDAVVMCVKAIGENIVALVKTFGEIIDFVKNVFTGNWSGAWENIKNIFKIRYDAIIGIFGAFNIDLPAIVETIKTTITDLWSGMFNGLKNIAKGAIDRIAGKISSIWDKIQAAKDAIASLRGGGSSESVAGARASGGSVIAGQLYKINELGSEYFRPAVNGTISRSPNSSSPQITLQFGDVHIGSESDMNTFTEKVRAVLIENYRNLALGTY